MRTMISLAALALLAAVPTAGAQAPSTAAAPAAAAATAAAPAPAPTLKFLLPSDVDPMFLMPPPIADGSAAQVAEVAEVLALQKGASPERYAQAVWDDRHESAELFAPTLGPSFNLAALPATAKLIYFDRVRPWTFNADIQACEAAGRNGAARRSYPSAHATLGFVQGVILANLMPDKAQVILARSADFALSRVICGVHYKSDIVASQGLGTAMGMMLLHNATFKPELEAARTELQAAGLTRKLVN